MTSTTDTLLEKLDDATPEHAPDSPAFENRTMSVLERMTTEAFEQKVQEAAPSSLDPKAFIRHALSTVRQNNDLARIAEGGAGTDPMSILTGVMRAGALGLDLDPTLGQAYLVPRRERGTHRAVFQIGYRGLLELAMRTGKVARIEVERIHENDHFVAEKGTAARLEFRPDWLGDRGALRGWYALAELRSGVTQWTVMSLAEMIDHRDRYAPSKDGKAVGPWAQFFEEMGDKTVFLRLARWLPKSVEMTQVIAEDPDSGVVVDADVIDADDA